MYGNHQYTSSSSGPLPHPPPPPQPPPRYDRYDSYPPPPPPMNLPPPPPLPSYPQRWDRRDGRDNRRDGRDSYDLRDRSDDHRFRGPYSDLRQPRGSYSDSRDSRDSRDEHRPPRGEFTFRQDAPGGIRAPPHPRHNDRGLDTYAPRFDGPRRPRGDRRPDRARRNGPYQRYEKEKAADRLLLSKRFDDKPELMLGDTAIRATYRDLDELSDSDEVDMDISDNGDSDSNAAERPTKRVRTDDVTTNATTDMPKKWSNPDPYTALPPPETTRKKDVVQLIRKARVQAEAQKPAVPSEAADFISCDFSDDENTSHVPSQEVEALQPDVGSHAPSTSTRVHAIPSTLPPKPPVATPYQDTNHLEKVQTTIQSLPPNPTNQSNKKLPLPADLAPSTSLGNRKRTIDDEIKLPHAPLKKVNRMPSGGNISPTWKPVSGENPCPWAVDDHSGVPNMGTRLHFEIRDFYNYVSPRDFEQKVRRQLVSNLETLIQKKWRDARILPFGSFMSGLYLPTADMDIAVCSQGFVDGRYPVYDKKKFLFQMRSHLEMHNVAYRNTIEAITKAKVPLLKYTDSHTGLKVDISFEKLDGYRAIDTFRKWKEQYPAMPPLVALIKHFLLMRSLNEPVNGGIGGFSVICMVVHLLQMMPQVQSGSMGDEHLGQLFMEFLDYYGNRFNYEKVAIRMDPPGTVNKAKANTLVYRNLNRLSIIDPNNPENDISGGSANYGQIKRCFATAYEALQKSMSQFAKATTPPVADPAKNALLYPLFSGNYSHFQLQRDWLQKLDRDGLQEYETPSTAKGTRVQW